MIRLTAALAAASLAACVPPAPPNPPAAPAATAPAAQVQYAGVIIYRERIALPPGARVQVQLQDVSRADAPAQILASQTIVGPGPPFAFSLSAPQDRVDAAAALALRAEIRVDDQLWFTTDTRIAAPKEGADGIEIRVVRTRG